MYLYYCSMWYGNIFYVGKAGWKGFDLFIITLFSGPLYLVYHIIIFLFSRSTSNKRLIIINNWGFALSILHCIWCGSNFLIFKYVVAWIYSFYTATAILWQQVAASCRGCRAPIYIFAVCMASGYFL